MKENKDNKITSKIPLLRPYFDAEELNEIQEVLDSGWVSQGPKVKELEDKIAAYLGVKYAIGVTNCTSALHLSLLSIGVKEGDEVLVADYTFPATGHAVLYCRAHPVFIDIDKNTYNINPSLLKNKINRKTKVIIPVHTFGQPAEMDEIMDIAKKHNLMVIEDAACALGAKYKNKYAGTIGDLGCFSFHARKGITTGEGGLVVTNNQNLAEKVRNLAVFGMKTAWEREISSKFIIPEFTEVGYNYKMSDLTAAVGIAQFKKLERIIKQKQKLARYWDEKLKEIEFIQPPYVNNEAGHIYQAYVALVDKHINRNSLIEKLINVGIQAQIGTYASHSQPVYKSKEKCPNSLEIFNRALALPLYYHLMEENIDLVVLHLKKFLEEEK